MKKVSYALGMSVAHNIMASGVKDFDVTEFAKAVEDVTNGEKTKIADEEAQGILKDFFTKLQEEQIKAFKAEGEAFLAENAKKEGIITLESGLQYKVITEGTGAKPLSTDTVECHYEGKLINGAVFDSSYQRGQTATFGVTQVIKGWVEALQLMNEGSKWQLFIPYNLAYGEQGAGQQIPPFATLIFDVEIVKIVK